MTKKIGVSFFGLLLIVMQCYASPEVIADFGGRDTGYRDVSEKLAEAQTRTGTPNGTLSNTQARRQMTNRFPIRNAMTVGAVDSREHHKSLEQPFFIIGMDRVSLDWLSQNETYLREINAVGMLTQVDSEADVNRVTHHYAGMKFIAIPLERIITAFDLRHYPVLITNTSVLQ